MTNCMCIIIANKRNVTSAFQMKAATITKNSDRKRKNWNCVSFEGIDCAVFQHKKGFRWTRRGIPLLRSVRSGSGEFDLCLVRLGKIERKVEDKLDDLVRNLNDPIFKTSNARALPGGGKLKFRVDRRTTCQWKKGLEATGRRTEISARANTRPWNTLMVFQTLHKGTWEISRFFWKINRLKVSRILESP